MHVDSSCSLLKKIRHRKKMAANHCVTIILLICLHLQFRIRVSNAHILEPFFSLINKEKMHVYLLKTSLCLIRGNDEAKYFCKCFDSNYISSYHCLMWFWCRCNWFNWMAHWCRGNESMLLDLRHICW